MYVYVRMCADRLAKTNIQTVGTGGWPDGCRDNLTDITYTHSNILAHINRQYFPKWVQTGGGEKL